MEVNAYSNLDTSGVSTQAQTSSSLNANSSLFDKLMAHNVNQDKENQEYSSLRALASFSQNLATLNINAKDMVKDLSKDIESSSDTSNTHDALTLMLELKALQAS